MQWVYNISTCYMCITHRQCSTYLVTRPERSEGYNCSTYCTIQHPARRSLCIYNSLTTAYNHHHMQSQPPHKNTTTTTPTTQCKLQCVPIHFVHTLVKALVLGKTPPAQVAAGDDDHDCKWSIFASWWKEKHHQRKLHSVKTILGIGI